MRPYIYLRKEPISFCFGWFLGEELTLLSIDLFKTAEDQYGKIDQLTVFSLQILKFFISFVIS